MAITVDVTTGTPVTVITVDSADPIEISVAVPSAITVTVDVAGGEINTGSSLGAGEAVFAGKLAADLTFKSLIGGTDISLSSDADEITIDSTAAGITEFTVTTTDGTLTTIGSVPIVSGTAVGFSIRAVGNEINAESYSNRIEGLISNISGTTALVPDNLETEIASSGAASWGGVTAVANDSTDALDIKVQGLAATSVAWRVQYESVTQ